MRRHKTSILTISLKKNRQKANKVMGLLVLATIRFKSKQSRAKEGLHERDGGETKSKRVNGASGISSSNNCQVIIC